uniref:ATP synthase peripheral stalk subunit F6, mitochondrial n=1 Tax=Eptatretus burgeri TaxID=7764 RepID=A0A8C4Q636_EPTBU
MKDCSLYAIYLVIFFSQDSHPNRRTDFTLLSKNSSLVLVLYFFDFQISMSLTNLEPLFLRIFLESAGGPVDGGQDYSRVFSEEMQKLQRLYGGGDLEKFPDFRFEGT